MMKRPPFPLSVRLLTTNREAPRHADIVFVHGLNGSAESTWASGEGDAHFWPKWLSDDFPYVGVWVLDYPAAAFWWHGTGTNTSMALPERARSVTDLLANRGIGRRPLIFIAHSLGGLLVKQILRSAQSFGHSDWRRLLDNTRGVVFLATPNTGAGLGTIADALRILGVSQNASQLYANEPHLLDLTTWYS
jgi:triacylglycerol esterase/lipase EstA (alpha/beta hydrolase family)